MAVAPQAHDETKNLYGWLERPSYLTGAASAFDFLGITSWWSHRRFRGDADRYALLMDFAAVAQDCRRAYYITLRDEGLEPPEERSQTQFSFFDSNEFRVER